MAMKPPNFEWLNFTENQRKLLDRVDFYGNNGWGRNGQSEVVMPKLLAECAEEGLTIDEVVEAMQSIGYDKQTVHQLRRWENKRLTGKFGK